MHKNLVDVSPWILRFADAVPDKGTVLDLACGGGRHGRFFLARGQKVLFLDRDIAALSDLAETPSAELIGADLETYAGWPLADRLFGAVIVTNYLWRPILPQIVSAIAPGGLLLYETFALGNEAFGRPRNPNFLLKAGELLEAVRGQLEVLGYEHLQLDTPSPRVIQHIAARRPS
ncbi:MAG: class I SAM-dependent methyltransferase [Rhodospirillaceae bacterium]|nr:class I SAM-dependent methyltransferase [Rhodospirillaceae bacterium]MDD9913128.1 class I SAM-dependent methyltransferase [Rhodospirillaceae bacterium]MDD9924901.1 class I SAM-dependent methyltransferase [Rhodospirillaceae bacterium]